MDLSISLSQAQEIMCNQIDAWRASIADGFFTYNGAQWDCNSVSQNNIIGACLLATANGGNLPPGFQWRDYNNNMVGFTGVQMIGMGSEMFNFVSAVYVASWTHKANVMALTTTADVAAYNYTDTLWPNPMTQI